LATASLICSLVGLLFCGVPAILGIIFGAVALSQINSNPRPGRGLAIAGLIVGVVAVIVWTLLWILAVRFGESCISIGSTGC
jgi:Na+/proline symporter